ncbi:hypothetical protein H2200_008229 [Cladophialophora chaetospira]|uniref:Copper-fist domain-containing protein n=1 Tax=Cladophialophora chaetospira TaxID=386627 RepID=A0AA38X5K0_9EURO|nr:hypothetical protein H2200_008229 [Cladophialophora chaetospira]
MLINGEKFACEACVRGHRVSSCHHQDRLLVHVNKKGRPVSQCQHCRGLRKSRSQHVKCECQDKAHSKENCPHDKHDGKHGAPAPNHTPGQHDADDRTDPQTCCCQHGSRCNCALKKEPHLDPVPEDIPQYIQPKDHAKQWHNKNSHDPKTTIFTNGHHKPVHKFNDAHNQLGAPYKIPSRSNSLHGHRELAQRSTDNLLLTKTAKPFHESPLHNSITEAMQIVERKVRSEHSSPVLGPARPAPNTSIPDFRIPAFDPRSYAYSPYSTDTPPSQPNSLMNSQNPSQQDLTLPETFPENWFMTYDQAHQYEPPISGRYNDGSSVDWTGFNLDLNNANNNTGLYGLNNPQTTASPYALSQQAAFLHSPADLANQINKVGISPSSGEHSEAEEPSPNSNNTGWNNDRPMSNELSSPGADDASDRHRLSSASSYFGTPQANMLADDGLGNLAIDDFLQQAEAETKRMQMQTQMAQMQMNPQDAEQPSRLSSVSRGMTPSISTPGSTGTGEHSYTVREAMRIAHPDGYGYGSIQQRKVEMPSSFMAEDPSWSAAPDMSDPQLVLDDERDDEDWVR